MVNTHKSKCAGETPKLQGTIMVFIITF